MRSLITVISVCAAIAVVATITFAQPDSLWSRTYGGGGSDWGMSVAPAGDGGYVMAGYTDSFGDGGFDAFIVKTNASGDTLWSRTAGGTSTDYALKVGRTSDAGFYLIGWTGSFGVSGYDGWLIKFDSDGDTIWSRTYGGPGNDQAVWGQETSDGGFILTGRTNSWGAGNYDYWLVKTTATGDTMWTRSFGGPLRDETWYVEQTSDGGYIVAGLAKSFGAGLGDYWLVKTDANGDSMWSRTYGGLGEDVARCARQTADGGYVVAGYSNRNTGISDGLLIKIDADGDSLWSYTYGAANDYEALLSVHQTGEGGYAVAGGTQASGGPYNGDVLLIRLDGAGNPLWNRTFGGAGDDAAVEMRSTSDDGYIIAGITSSFGAGDYDAWLLKTGPDPLSIEDNLAVQPASYNLQSYPNPFNPATTITYYVPSSVHVTLRVLNLHGQEVATLHEGRTEAGIHHATFQGDGLAAGIYFVRLDAGEFSKAIKLVLMK